MSLIASPLAIGNARVNGILREDGGLEFRGIRYAISERFKDPIDTELDGEISAVEYGPICLQTPGFLEQTLGLDSSSMSEDCLSLNVFVPPNTQSDSKRPVLFWIHGGAYTNGAGSLAWYHGSRLASRGCIVVTINYRLGIFGFFGDTNCGVKDMTSALRWTNKYIEHFGGDKEKITIFGESAGGSAVVSLLATPSATPLFHRAWAMSPSIGQLRTRERSLEIERTILEIADVSNVAELDRLAPTQLLTIQDSVLSRASTEYDWFAPTEDTATIPFGLLSRAASSQKQFVIGTNRDENKLWAAFDPKAADVTQDHWHQHANKIFASKATEAITTYESLRPGESPHLLISAVNTDVGFRARAWALVDERLQHDCPTWMYWFTWATPAFGGILGSCHALDIPFAFDNLDAPGGDMLTGDDPRRLVLAARFADEIAQFAAHGHPSWSQYNLVNRDTLQLDDDVTLVSDPEKALRELFTAG